MTADRSTVASAETRDLMRRLVHLRLDDAADELERRLQRAYDQGYLDGYGEAQEER